MATQCQNLADSYIECRMIDGSCESCSPFDPSAGSLAIENRISEEFLKVQITTDPSSPEYCEIASEGICDRSFEEDTCCCKSKFVKWQKCMTEKDLSPLMGLPEPCVIDCVPKPPKTECTTESQNYMRCLAMDTGSCAACPPKDLNTLSIEFPQALKQRFMMTMASTSSQDPGFCDIASAGICGDYENNACCCEAEFGTWQSCLTAKDFSPEINLPTPCAVTCSDDKGRSSGGSGGSGGGGMIGIIVGVVVVVLLAAAGGGYFFLRKRRASATAFKNESGLDGLDASDDDLFKDEKEDPSAEQKRRGIGGLFSRGKKKCDSTDGESNENFNDNDGDDRRGSGRDRNNKKRRDSDNRRADAKTPPGGKKRGGRNTRKDRSDFSNRDIENGGLPTDLSMSQDEESDFGDRQSTTAASKTSRKSNRSSRRLHDDEDSIENDYGDRRNDRRGSFDNRGANRKSAREKKRDLENSHQKGSRESSFRRSSSYNEFDDDISELENDGLSYRSGSAYRTSSAVDLPSDIKSSKKISSRELKNLMKERESSSRRLTEMEDEMADFQRRLAKRDREADDLRREREEQARRIKELEDLNQRLQKDAKRSSSRRNLADDLDGSGRYTDDSESFGGNSRHNRSSATGVGRSSRSKASMRDDSSHNRGTSKSRRHSGRSTSRPRERSRSQSGARTLERSGSRRPQSRSPSSTRGLGKQASSTRRRGESRDRGESRRAERSSAQRKTRSKSPRSYLRDED